MLTMTGRSDGGTGAGERVTGRRGLERELPPDITWLVTGKSSGHAGDDSNATVSLKHLHGHSKQDARHASHSG